MPHAGVPFTPDVVVALLDSAGHIVFSATDRVSLELNASDSAAALLGATSVNAVAGRAWFTDLRVERAGSGYTLVARSAGGQLAHSDSFMVTPEPRAGIRFVVLPDRLETGSPFLVAPEAQLVDRFGNAVTDTAADGRAVLTLVGAPAGVIASGVTAHGRIAFPVMFPGCQLRPDYRLEVTGPDGLSDSSGPIMAVPGQPAKLTVVPGWQPPADPGRPFSISFALRDWCNNIGTNRDSVPVVRSTWTVPEDAVVEGPTTALSAAGIATFADLRLDRSAWFSLTVNSRSGEPYSTGLFLVVLRNTRLAAGRASTCLLHPTGRVLCWGDNSEGQLGDGTVGGSRGRPALAVGSFGTEHLAVGAAHACAVDAAGWITCWGANDAGQGGRTGGSSGTPTPVTGPLTDVRGLAAGTRHTCATTAHGTFCWGDNTSGQLGTGAASPGGPTPAAVWGGHPFTQITAGDRHTCALDTGGLAWCWGSNERGQLGIATIGGSRDTAVAVSGGLSFTAIVAGADHTCALTANGPSYCWGANDQGQLGLNAPSGDSGVPVATGFQSGTALTAGANHTCVSYQGPGYQPLYCWGDNSYGQLQQWSLDVDRLAGGARHTCANSDRGLFCWGDNGAGQLGAGSVGPLAGSVFNVRAPATWDLPVASPHQFARPIGSHPAEPPRRAESAPHPVPKRSHR